MMIRMEEDRVRGYSVPERGEKFLCSNHFSNPYLRDHIKHNGILGECSYCGSRETVLDLVKVSERVVPVGRLDMYTSGALILTDDGDFIYKVTHPKHEIDKTYTVTVIGIVENDEVEKLRNGVVIDEVYTTKPAKVKILKTDKETNKSRLEITIHEGKNRQVRKMCEAVGRKVIALHRSRIGNIDVKDLKIGTWRYLTDKEIKDILK